jgi:hypothetical protein
VVGRRYQREQPYNCAARRQHELVPAGLLYGESKWISGGIPLGGCTIWYSINFPDGPRCFGGLFEIVAPHGMSLPLARRGDSGVWIVDQILSTRSWNGMLISAVPDGDRAYCCFAQDILEVCQGWFLRGFPLSPSRN